MWYKIVRLTLAFSALILATFVMCDQALFPLPIERLTRPSSHYIYSAEGLPLGQFTSEDQFWRLPAKIGEISPRLVSSVIEIEDKWFYYHPGINPVSLLNAAIENVKAGRVVRGGSTITMQIARMIEPKERTIVNKLFEIFRAIQLEIRFSKDELLEYYFNLAPYGGNIEGPGSASLHYFDHSVKDLTISEAAILTSIPSSPNRYRPDRNPEQLRQRRDVILHKLFTAGVIGQEEFQSALSEEIPYRRVARVSMAPHVCQQVISDRPANSKIKTTINHQLQSLCSRLATQHHLHLKDRGIHNLAVVVLENSSGKVRALIGSPKFTDNLHGGQVNAALAPRSPGSTLKPFVYALAFEQGDLTPSSLVEDIPVNFSGYRPVNYDEEYHGVVTASDALIRSLNVPAVNVTAKIGLTKIYNLFKRGGINSLRGSALEHGLPLILGGCEVSLLELTALYSSLAREGIYLRPSLYDDTSAGNAQLSNPRRILTKEACFLVSQILVDLERPTFPSSWEFTTDIPHVAWKTGTSYGRRDAWTIGYTPEYTVGVWIGNVSGEGSPDLVGADVAAPLLFSIFQEMSGANSNRWLNPPGGIGEREVCALSGEAANGFCPSTRRAQYIIDVSALGRCKIHVEILVDRESGHLLCRACSPQRELESRVVERWPSRLSSWLIGQGVVSALPRHNPDCSGLFSEQAPVVNSPESFGVYKIRDNAPREHQLILLAASVSPDCARIHWFVDNNLLTVSDPGERIFYVPTPGKHRVLCVDDQGRSASVDFIVE